MSETPLAWFYFAHAYLHDAAVLNAASKPLGGHHGAPTRFLYFHAIELFLKTYLKLCGMKEAELIQKRFGHNLSNLADEAERQGLSITKRVRRVCVPDTERHVETPIGTRYLRTGATMIVPPNRLHEAGRELQFRIEEALHAAGIPTKPLPELPVVHQKRGLTISQAAKLLARSRA